MLPPRHAALACCSGRRVLWAQVGARTRAGTHTHASSSPPTGLGTAGSAELSRFIRECRNESLAPQQLGRDEVMWEHCSYRASCYKTEGSVSAVVQYVYGHLGNGESRRH